jgi:regulator of sigma E protease
MLGEEDDGGNDSRSLANKSVGMRAIIFAAGATLNLILAFILFLFIILFVGYTTNTVMQVADGSPAAQIGIKPGDRIVKINNSNIHIYYDLNFVMTLADGKPMQVTYMRGSQKYEASFTPDQDGGYKLGVVADSKTGFFQKPVEGYSSTGIWESVKVAAYQIWFYVKATVVSLIKLVTFQLPMSDLSGPIGIGDTIVKTYNESAAEGPWIVILNMVNLCGLLSANLGVFNLLPLPALDGGRLVFILIEAIRGKPVPVDKEGLVHTIGFVLLMALAVVIAISDVRKLL